MRCQELIEITLLIELTHLFIKLSKLNLLNTYKTLQENSSKLFKPYYKFEIDHFSKNISYEFIISNVIYGCRQYFSYIASFFFFSLSCIKYLFWAFLFSITKVKFSTQIETDCSKMYSLKEKKNWIWKKSRSS